MIDFSNNIDFDSNILSKPKYIELLSIVDLNIQDYLSRFEFVKFKFNEKNMYFEEITEPSYESNFLNKIINRIGECYKENSYLRLLDVYNKLDDEKTFWYNAISANELRDSVPMYIKLYDNYYPKGLVSKELEEKFLINANNKCRELEKKFFK